MRITKKILRSWIIKIIAILIVVSMILTGFAIILWK
jgi:hypothetical protein